MIAYEKFIDAKGQSGRAVGFEPIELPATLKDFQRHLCEWSIRRGRAAIFADCGMGKTLMQLTWADNVRRHTNGNVLIVTPLAVSSQTKREADKFGFDATRSQDGKHNGGIVVTNYERLGHFDANDFVGIVCDESSILKNIGGQTRKRLTRFMAKLPYRLLCTATAAPNDYVELGTSSEALGELSHSDMLKRFFAQLDDKGQRKEQKAQDDAEAIIREDARYYQKLAFRVAQTIGQWRLKHHAVDHFWRWVASWARACRMPSDLGFDDAEFILPPLVETDHIIEAPKRKDRLFHIPAKGIGEERDERRRTIGARCEFISAMANHDRPVAIWCHGNDEADAIEAAIPGAVQVAGKTSDDRKCEIYDEFSAGNLRVIVIKYKIGAFGLNWQHCSDVIGHASHSYEQYYQSIRRFYRFGQLRPVKVDTVATEGEVRVLANMRRKAERAANMFSQLVKHMRNAERIERENLYTNRIEVPQWL
jgi:superfamily II DNA or RNA helicase